MLLQGNAFWKLVRNLLKTPGKEQIACHYPKPILLDTGEMKLPYDWAVSFNHYRTFTFQKKNKTSFYDFLVQLQLVNIYRVLG